LDGTWICARSPARSKKRRRPLESRFMDEKTLILITGIS
jgi:hypothetical protein